MHLDEDFLRYTHGSVFCWYQQADSKAHVILGFTGVFLSILVGALIAEYMKSGLSVAKLHGAELLLFVVAVACHLGAVMFSTVALWSRGVFESNQSALLSLARSQITKAPRILLRPCMRGRLKDSTSTTWR
ncbi:MAG: hypothetical protein WAL40_00800 [Rhodoplanes sp.]